ncbi:hypothetical protein PR202_ga24303 [Eleusine coracana subsp. coracana]|uniref:FRIGIDA-like protein n=1 Tax=Eleusine coracana subsp. coracana TaxID=191504 RepID=A0AAV5D8R2_ELECO|nr:hypothetical protein PR202_ga24303 [Eleusine coracana subsp. coracana]
MERQVARQIVEFKCKTMEEELKKLGLKVNHHERNIKFLKSELNAVEEACVDLGTEGSSLPARSKMPLMKDILGFVATLGKVNDDNLSRILSEYLGMDNMLALVCKTYDSVKGLEKYDKNGFIDKSSGLHGLAHTIGKVLDGRFTVFCLENLR